MKTIGITGGIGSGKSTVAKIFVSMGYPVYNSDVRAKDILNVNPKVISKISNLFGKNIYNDGEIDRKKLASIVFGDKEKLAKLNAIVHPAVGEDFETWRANQTTSFVLKESAILFETGIYKKLDSIILVTSPIKTRIERIQIRDNSTQKEIESRIQNQWLDEKKIPLSNFIIDNSGEILIIPQVLQIIEKIK